MYATAFPAPYQLPADADPANRAVMQAQGYDYLTQVLNGAARQ